jgi:HD-like signal output (HDOD) protein
MNHKPCAVLERLNKSRLPVLPVGISALIESLANESIHLDKLSHELAKFPTIAARLIVVANSAWSAPISPIVDLEKACGRLGLDVVRNISLALAVAAPFTAHQCISFDIPRFWCRALLAAEVASLIGKMHAGRADVGLVTTAALFHNLGVLLLADQMPEDMVKVLLLHKNTSGSKLSHLLRDRMGFDYADAGSCLAEAWGLPTALVTMIGRQMNTAQHACSDINTQIVGVAVALAQAAEMERLDELRQLLAPVVNLQGAELEKLIARILSSLARNIELARNLGA